MRLLITGGSGVLGRALRPIAQAAGHDLYTPTHAELDLFDPAAVAAAVANVDAVLHLATRIPSLDEIENLDAWRENDRLRIEATRNLVDASLAAAVESFVVPTVAFVYPEDGPTTEDTPVGDVLPVTRSALVAERETERFTRGGRHGVVLRLGLLDGPGTGHDEPLTGWDATLHVDDAALALLAALYLPAGIYNVCRDGEAISNRKFTESVGWRPATPKTHSGFGGL